MKKIAIIPARSGSKGLPNKNILILGNKPLIAYTIEAAVKSKIFDRIIVSTDSLEYKFISEKYGAEVLIRNKNLADDKATTFMVIEDVLKQIKEKYDYFVLLQPTSPFRTFEHIKESAKLFEKNINNFDFLVSMEESSKASILIKPIADDNSLKEYDFDFSNYTRQKYKEYFPNGAIYIGKIDKYLNQKHFFGSKSLAYFMNKEDSIDIDDKLDFEIAISILEKKNKNIILKESIKNQISKKTKIFNKDADIALIGHSILDKWEIKKFKNYSVNNLSISGISTQQYIELILDKNKIKKLPKYIILMLGTNDIIDETLNVKNIIDNINILISKLYKINLQVKIFFLEISSVAFRMDRKKEEIVALNSFIKENLNSTVEYIEINKYLVDKFGNLKLKYTDDGLHFNKIGYKKFKYALEKEIKI